MAFFNNAINGRGQLTTTFTGSGTWTPDHRTNFVQLLMWNAGSGGGSGRQGASAAAGGGGGGSGGNMTEIWISRSVFGTSETVTIGAGGGGGGTQAAVANGNPGSAGGATKLGNLFADNRGPTGNIFGGGGTTSSGAGGVGNLKGVFSAGIGALSSASLTNLSAGAGSNTAGGSALYIITGVSTPQTDFNCYGVAGGGGGGAGGDAATERAGGTGSGIRFCK